MGHIVHQAVQSSWTMICQVKWSRSRPVVKVKPLNKENQLNLNWLRLLNELWVIYTVSTKKEASSLLVVTLYG